MSNGELSAAQLCMEEAAQQPGSSDFARCIQLWGVKVQRGASPRK